jgi:VanZ family protein
MVNTVHEGDGARNNSSVMRRLVRYGPLLVWIAFISFASTGEFSADNTSRIVRPILLWLFPEISEGTLASIHFLTRKAAHFCEYAVLGLLARRAFISSSKPVIRRHWFAIALGLVVVNSLLDELHQAFLPTRTGSIYDSAIDMLGGLTVLLIFKFYGKAARDDRTKH